MNLWSGPACWGRCSQAPPDHCLRWYMRSLRPAAWLRPLQELLPDFASFPRPFPSVGLGHGSANDALLTDWQGTVMSY